MRNFQKVEAMINGISGSRTFAVSDQKQRMLALQEKAKKRGGTPRFRHSPNIKIKNSD
jgi:hypothetical protein